MGSARVSSPVRVGEVLTAAVPALRERMLETAIRRDWAQVVGPEVARRSEPGELRMGALTVTVDNSPWLHELTLRSDDLLRALRSRHGGAVSSLRFSLGTIAAPPRQATRGPLPDREVTLDSEGATLVDTLVASVSDPALGVSLRRLLVKDLIARRRRDPNRRQPSSAPTEREDP